MQEVLDILLVIVIMNSKIRGPCNKMPEQSNVESLYLTDCDFLVMRAMKCADSPVPVIICCEISWGMNLF